MYVCTLVGFSKQSGIILTTVKNTANEKKKTDKSTAFSNCLDFELNVLAAVVHQTVQKPIDPHQYHISDVSCC